MLDFVPLANPSVVTPIKVEKWCTHKEILANIMQRGYLDVSHTEMCLLLSNNFDIGSGPAVELCIWCYCASFFIVFIKRPWFFVQNRFFGRRRPQYFTR